MVNSYLPAVLPHRHRLPDQGRRPVQLPGMQQGLPWRRQGRMHQGGAEGAQVACVGIRVAGGPPRVPSRMPAQLVPPSCKSGLPPMPCLQCAAIANCTTYSTKDCKCTACKPYFTVAGNGTSCQVGRQLGGGALRIRWHTVGSERAAEKEELLDAPAAGTVLVSTPRTSAPPSWSALLRLIAVLRHRHGMPDQECQPVQLPGVQQQLPQ